jgi:bifunctional non-homologous end joining protein LigD
MSKKVEIEFGGKRLTVSNLGKILYPKVGFTKGEVIDYYIRISPVLLPHLKNRPITLKRYPDGVEGFFFYEKQCPSHRPAWVKTTEVPSSARAGLGGESCRAPAIKRPTALAFDLDPGAPADIVLVLPRWCMAASGS